MMVLEQESSEVKPCKVLLIDDRDNEAIPLLSSLSKKGIPVLYYKGLKKDLPASPVSGIRIVFLDMILKGMQKQPPETVVSNLMNILKNVISAENGPYMIFAWTQHTEIVKVFREHLAQRGKDVPKPCFIVDVDKTECFNDGKADLDKISVKLTEKLSDLPILDFIINWEKTIEHSTCETISLVNGMVNDEEWVKEFEQILYTMAKGDSGDHLENSVKIDTAAMNVLNSLLKDCIERNLKSKDLLKKPSQDPEISVETCAITNGTIHVRTLDEGNLHPAPGNLYLLNFDSAKNFFDYLPSDETSYKQSFFKSTIDLTNVKLCMLEITPICDYANNKWKCNRFLLGVLVPESEISKVWGRTKYLYITPLLFLENMPCHVVLDFHYLAGNNFEKLAGLNTKYQFRMELLSYIQTEMTNYLTRPGLFIMD